MIKHVLTDWQLSSKQAWWYKMQLFNTNHYAGPLLYFDLDTVIVNNIDWIWQSPTAYFWAVKDFKYLWRPDYVGPNSSIMWWDTPRYQQVWSDFVQQDLATVVQRYRGDQDYISVMIAQDQRRFFDPDRVQSWRWQCLDGGYDFNKKRHLTPGSGTAFADDVSVVIFHGNPKPAKIVDQLVIAHWQ
jgi:hypothetical protein